MLKFTLDDLFQLPSAIIYEPDQYINSSNVSIDSRNIKPNSIFVAIKGDKYDGHKFAKSAVQNGAGTIVIERSKLKYYDDLNIPIITVPDTTAALGRLANCWRNKLSLKVISITGSCGKTSVKEMLAEIISEKFKVHKTDVNNNNHIGVPLTILAAKAKHDVLILEHGTNHFGEIEYTANIAEPDLAIITNIGNSHLEYFNNKQGVLKEKSYLFHKVWANQGTAFINTDDTYLRKLVGTKNNSLTFGFKGSPNVKGQLLGYSNNGFPIVRINYKKRIIEATVPLLGESSAKNFLAASVIALKLGLTKKQILDAANKLKPSKQRLNVKKYKNFTLVDDTYNSNPDSLKSSINAVSKIKNRKNRIFILGDMFELGRESATLHKNAANFFKRKTDKVYTIGKLMKGLFHELEKFNPNCRHFRTRKSLNNFLQKIDLHDSVLLVKGSRGMAMEEFIKVMEEHK